MIILIKNAFINQLRNTKWIVFSAVFPIFLMVLIGTILVNDFERNIDSEPITVYYLEEGNKNTDFMLEVFKKNIQDKDIFLKAIDSLEKGKEQVRINRGVLIHFEEDSIKVYSTNKEPVEGATIFSILRSIKNRVNVTEQMFRINPEKAQKILSSNNFISDMEVEVLEKEDAPSSYDYYGVVEITMMVLYILLFPLGALEYEKKKGMRERISLTGIGTFYYFTSRIVASFMISILIIMPGFLFSLFILDVNWGLNPLLAFGYILSFNLISVTFGTLVGYIAKDYEKATLIIQGMLIPVISFLGGSYMALGDELGGAFQMVANFSPLRWLNRGLFRMIYSEDFSILNWSLAINLIIFIVLVGLLFIFAKREEKI